ncbi:acetylxylan esterase [bacterium]|nr:acetylxylan esterase [bacterium]
MRLVELHRNGFRSILALVLMLTSASANAAVSVSVDHADGVYALGTPASFSLTSTSAGNYTISFIRDGLITTETTTVYLSATPVVIKKTLYQPGWLMIRNGSTDLNGAIWDPYHLQPGMGSPADFESWWTTQKNKLAGSYTPEIVSMTTSISGANLWHVKLPMPEGRQVQGYLTKPIGAAAKSLPAILYTHGSGVVGSTIRSPFICNGTLSSIAFDINAHGIDDGQPKSYYDALDAGELKYYRTEGWDSRDTVYFRLMYLRALRAIDFLTKQPEWDGKTLVVFGSSQGGAQNLAVAGLDSRVTVVVAGAPAICDQNAWVNNRRAGWPQIVAVSGGTPTNPSISNTALYYDSVNFARRIKAASFFSTGLIDNTCPSVSVLPAYNLLQSETKKIMIVPKRGHVFWSTSAQTEGEVFVKAYFDLAHKNAAQLLPYE